jgi:hypothetical protein
VSPAPREEAASRGAAQTRVVVFVAAAAALTVLLIVYTVTHRRPLIPADRDHLEATAPDRCLSCHGPGMRDQRGPNHPLNDQCFNCHERA